MESTNLVVTNEVLSKDVTSDTLITDYIILHALGYIDVLDSPAELESSVIPESRKIENVLSKLQTFFRVCSVYLNNLELVISYQITADYNTVSCRMDTNEKIGKQLYFTVTMIDHKFAITAAIDGETYEPEEAVKYAINCVLNTAGQIDINHIIYLHYAFRSGCIDLDKIYAESADEEGDDWLTEETSFLALAEKYSDVVLGDGDIVMNWTSGSLPTFSEMMNNCLDIIRPFYKNKHYVSEDGKYIHSRMWTSRNCDTDTVYTKYPVLDGLHICDTWLGYYHLNDMYDMSESDDGVFIPTLFKAIIDCIMFSDMNIDTTWLVEILQDEVIGNEGVMLPELRRVALHYGVDYHKILYWLTEAKISEE